MTDRLLRHIPSGIIYAYQPVFAMRDDFEEIIDVESRVVPDAEPQAPKVRKPRKVETAPAEVEDIDAALSAQISRGMP